MEIGRTVKMILALAAVAVIMMFSEMRAGTLLAAVVGALMILLGLASYYRPACIVGLMLTAGSAAVSNDPGSLTVVASWLNAVFGILIPVYILTWASLNSTHEESYRMMLRSKASAYTLTFMLACLLSVPIAALLLGITSPRVSTAMSVLTEIAIMLTVATAGLILLTSIGPRANPMVETSEGPE